MTVAPQADHYPFLAGGGTLGRLIRSHPWHASPLGAPEGWPENLRTLVRVMLASRQPMFIAWGPERIMLYNDGYAPLCGSKHPAALGRRFDEVWADILDAVGPIMDGAYRGVPTYMENIQFTMLRHGFPEEAHFSFGYTPVQDDATGRVVGMFCTCLEITAQVMAARERKAEVDRLREMFRQAPGAIALLTGPDHVFEVANTAYLQLIGRNDVVGMPIAQALPELAEQGFVALLDKVRTSGEPFVGANVPLEIRRGPGAPAEQRLLDFVYQPISDASGSPSAIFVQATDVTERAQAEKALRDANERLELALAAGGVGGVGVWDWNVPLGIITGDERFARIYDLDPDFTRKGATPDEFFSAVHPDDQERVGGEVDVALRTGSLFATEYRLIRPDGALRWVLTQGRCALSPEDEALRFTGIAMDVTAFKEVEEAVRRAKDERDFVIALTAGQRRSGSPTEVMERTAELIGRRLGVNRAGFYRMADADTLAFGPGWSDGVLPLRTGSLPIDSLGPSYVETLRQGQVFSFGDVNTEPGVDAVTIGHRGTRSGINVPLVRSGQWESGLYLSGTEPRRWTGEELALVEEVAQLSWDAVERARAELATRRRAALLDLDDRLRDLTDTADLAYAAGETLGRTLGVARAGYGTIDAASETIAIERDWRKDGIATLAGTRHLRQHGSYIDDLKRGATVIVPDVRADVRTAATAPLLEGLDMRSFVDMPIIENGELVALLYLDDENPRLYPEDEIAFMREVGERTRAAVERRRAEAELRALNLSLERRVEERTAERNLLATIIETTDAFVQVVDADYRFLAINKASADEFEAIFGVRPKVGDNLLDLLAGRPEHQAAVQALWRRALGGEEFTEIQEFGDPGRTRRAYEIKFNVLRERGGQRIAAYQFAYDVSQRLAAQKRLTEAEEQVRQMQKMEAVGQLTGGIAHDFNNMMAVVIGGLNLLQRRLARGETDVSRYIDGAMDGAHRAASLTQRLLAFSRQQPLTPEPVDANQMISGMLELLTRTLGENVFVEMRGAPGLWRTRIDASQLENAILNLCVNARDAMPEGGRLVISTVNVDLVGTDAVEFGVTPGAYVVVAVSDTGSGMTPEVIEKAFDPFFTTKGVGKGTGLGLSQVFGFISQSGGHVKIDSTVGRGTTVRIFLPHFQGDAAAPREREAASTERAQDGEVVMVVEDEERVRAFSADALRELGYTVVETRSATEALAMIGEGQDVSLLFTDIVMPDMTGPQLTEQALRRRPDLKVLYTTGYARNALPQDGMLDPGTNFLPKPFGIEQLAAKVRGALDRG